MRGNPTMGGKVKRVRLIDFLMDLVERANIPKEQPEGTEGIWTTEEFPVTAKREYADGEIREEIWKVVVFYDVGELDYIEHFVDPEGRVLDWWAFPWHSEEHQRLLAWRGGQ